MNLIGCHELKFILKYLRDYIKSYINLELESNENNKHGKKSKIKQLSDKN